MTKEEIKEFMKTHKITYRELAKKLYISYGYLHDMLNGRRSLNNYGSKIKKILESEVFYE